MVDDTEPMKKPFGIPEKNGRNKTRNYTATARDEVKTLTMPDGQKELWQYDGNGNVSTYYGAYQAGDQWITTYAYDGSDRPTTVDYPTGTPDVNFGYSNYGHNVTMQEAGRSQTMWTYDSWGNLASYASPDGATLSYGYNRLGERTSMTDPGNGTTTYEYDTFGRLKKLTNWLSEITTWDYDDAGRMNKRTLGNGTWENIVYDSRSRPTSVDLRKPGGANGTSLRYQIYTYDAASNVLSHTLAGTTTTYEYDNINQLTREYRGPSGSPTWQIQYGYDANGNRTFRNILGGNQETYTNDDGDKLTSVTWAGGSKNFTYDGAGRRKTQTIGGSTTTYNWDHESRLISTTGAVATSYAYNGLDSRITRTDSGGTRNYRRDGAYVTDPVLGDGAATYTPGISERRSGTSRYLHSGIKNADSRTTTQAVEATREYDAFGNVIASSGTWQGPLGNAGAFGYQEDGDTGLKLLGHRYYDSTTGSFLSRDALETPRSKYSYCSNNPLKLVDADGLKPKLVIILGNTDGLPLAGLIQSIKDKFEAKYDIVIRRARTREDAVYYMEHADAVALLGHGSPLSMPERKACGDAQFEEVLRRRQKRGKKQLDFVLLYSCYGLEDTSTVTILLRLANAVYGWDDGDCTFPGRKPADPFSLPKHKGKWWRRPGTPRSPSVSGAGGPVRYP